MGLTPEGRGHVVTHALYQPAEMEKLRAEYRAEAEAIARRPRVEPLCGSMARAAHPTVRHARPAAPCTGECPCRASGDRLGSRPPSAGERAASELTGHRGHAAFGGRRVAGRIGIACTREFDDLWPNCT